MRSARSEWASGLRRCPPARRRRAGGRRPSHRPPAPRPRAARGPPRTRCTAPAAAPDSRRREWPGRSPFASCSLPAHRMRSMNYARALLLALVATLLLAPPALAAKGFQLGVTAGEVTSSSAVLWGKAKKSGKSGSTRSTSRAIGGSGAASRIPWSRRRAATTRSRRRSSGSARTRSTGSASSETARQSQRRRHVQDRAEAEAERHDQVRLERRPGLQPRAWQDDAVLEQRRGAGPHEGGAQPLQRHARRHDLLGQRGARAGSTRSR